MQTFNINDFYEGDWSLAAARALETLKMQSPATLYFPPGRYDFHAGNAYGEFSCISNHDDDCFRHFAFPIIGCHNLTLNAGNAEFIFHGHIVPFLIKESSGIFINGFSIDWEKPFYSQGTVSEKGDKFFNLEISSDYQYETANGRLYLDNEPLRGIAEIDPERGGLRFQRSLNLGCDDISGLEVEKISNNEIKFIGEIPLMPEKGSVLVLRHGRRNTPAIFINRSRGLFITDIKIYHAGGMGVIAQNSADLNIRSIAITPRPGSGRAFSICADALHFVNCSGAISIDSCRFENQLDDSINIHGIYYPLVRRLSDNSLLMKLAHPQHKGMNMAEPENRVRFIDTATLLPLCEGKVKRVDQLNLDCSVIELYEKLPDFPDLEMAMENLDWRPDKVEIRNCISKNNNPRGFLISVPGKVIIEKNYVSAPGAAVRISGDANSWFESGAVESVLIRDNIFEYCNYISRGSSKAVIDVVPEINSFPENTFYHNEIIVENNIFKNFYSSILYGWSVKRLCVRNNQIQDKQGGCKLIDINKNVSLTLED